MWHSLQIALLAGGLALAPAVPVDRGEPEVLHPMHVSYGRMVLEGKHVAGGESVVDRIAWTNNGDGTVRQVWEKSKDDGESWNAVFDGLYKKKE